LLGRGGVRKADKNEGSCDDEFAQGPSVFLTTVVRNQTLCPSLGLTAAFFAGFLLVGAPAQAQVLIGYLFGEKLASPTFNMGFEVGMNFSTLDGPSGAEREKRTVFGLFADWRFSKHVHLTTALLPIAGRGATGIMPIPTGDPAIDVQAAGASVTRSFSYIEFPILLKWAPKRDSGFRVGVGTSLGLVTGANDRYAITSPAGSDYTLERDIHDLTPGFDFGLSVDAEWRFKALAIAARYTEGLTDLRMPGEPNAVHSRVLTGTGRIALGKK